jgi:UDP-N-acetylmuramoyl-tripeptide--D-alanyl-D-alanine ligase
VLINRRDPFREYLAKQAAVTVVEFDCATANIAHTVAETVARQLNVKPEVIGHALSTAWQPTGRMRMLEGQYSIIDDSYNASPTSMAAALEKLGRMPGRRVAILGSMLELGSNEVTYHKNLGKTARSAADLVIGIGELARHYQPDHWFADSDQAATGVVAFLQKGDSILVKGSHGIRTDKIVEALQ